MASASIPRLLTARECADHLGVSIWTVRRLVAVGRLRAVRLTTTAPLRFDPSDVLAAIEAGRTR